jgi:hypothetical protein
VTPGSGSASGQNISLEVDLVLGTEAQNKLFVNGAESNAGYKVIVKQVKNGQKYLDLKSEF